MPDPFLSFEGYNEIRRRFFAVAADLDLPEEHPSGPEYAPPGMMWKMFMTNEDPDSQEEYEEEVRSHREEGLEGLPIPRYTLRSFVYRDVGAQIRELELEGFPVIRAEDVSDEFLEAADRHGLTCAGVEMRLHGAHPETLLGSECEMSITRTWILTEHRDPEDEVPWLVSRTAVPVFDGEKKPHLYLV